MAPAGHLEVTHSPHRTRRFCNNTAANSKLRHIDQRQHWISTLRDHNVVIPVHVSSAENVADLFTKPLTGDTFIRLRNTFLVER